VGLSVIRVSWLIHGERPSPWSFAGGGVILAATVAKSWLDRESSEPDPVPQKIAARALSRESWK
jgi:hypothetical protein